MTTYITVERRIYVNGKNVADLPDQEIYTLIAEQENQIKTLEAIENKPKRLQDEIAKRKAGIQDLVKMLDERDAK